MKIRKIVSIVAGFLILFAVYHFPEFFQSFLLNAIFKIGFLLIALGVARMQFGKGLGSFGLALSGRWIYSLLTGLAVGVIFFSISVFISVALGYMQIDKIYPLSFFVQQLPLVLLMTSFPSIAEDILTRGYLYCHFKRMNPFLWIFFSSVIYVLNHIWRLGEGMPVLTYLFMLGLALAACVLLTRSLWLAFGVHWGANIAYEFSRSGMVVQNSDDSMTRWVLAVTWVMLFLILITVYSFKHKRQSAAFDHA